MNEILFFLQIILVVFICMGAKKLGKGALYASVAVNALFANLFVLKQIDLFGFTVTASDAFAIGSLLSLNLLQEHYGIEESKSATWSCFLMMLFFATAAYLHLAYLPSSLDEVSGSYQAIFSVAPRLLFASIGVFFLVQQIDRRLFAFLQQKFPLKSFNFRSTISLFISQFLDTVLFSFVGLFGLVGAIYDVIFVSFLLKMIAIAAATTVVRAAKR